MSVGRPHVRRVRVRSSSGTLAIIAFAGTVLWLKPMGLLIWARMRILTNIPRTAIADDPLFAALPAPGLDLGLPVAERVDLPGGATAATRNPFTLRPEPATAPQAPSDPRRSTSDLRR